MKHTNLFFTPLPLLVTSRAIPYDDDAEIHYYESYHYYQTYDYYFTDDYDALDTDVRYLIDEVTRQNAEMLRLALLVGEHSKAFNEPFRDFRLLSERASL